MTFRCRDDSGDPICDTTHLRPIDGRLRDDIAVEPNSIDVDVSDLIVRRSCYRRDARIAAAPLYQPSLEQIAVCIYRYRTNEQGASRRDKSRIKCDDY